MAARAKRPQRLYPVKSAHLYLSTLLLLYYCNLYSIYISISFTPTACLPLVRVAWPLVRMAKLAVSLSAAPSDGGNDHSSIPGSSELSADEVTPRWGIRRRATQISDGQGTCQPQQPTG